MPGLINAQSSRSGFAGLPSIYQYTNSDGKLNDNECGQAACATLLTYCGYMPAGDETLRAIEKTHPQDLRYGSSPWRIEKTLRDYGCSSRKHVHGLEGIKKYVASCWPVISVIQNKPGLRGLKHSAHWFVVFAYDDGGVFVTNYKDEPYITWSDFDQKQHGLYAVFAGIDFKSITNNQFKSPFDNKKQ